MHEVRVEKSATISLTDLIDSAVKGDDIIFTENNLPVAKLTAVHKHKPQPRFGSAKGMFVMAADFDEPLADFDEYQ